MAKKSSGVTEEFPLVELLPVLSFAQGFTAAKDIVPALRSLYFNADALSAFNGVTGVICYLPWSFGPRFALPGESLLRIVSSLHAQGVETLRLKVADKVATVQGGGFSGRLSLPQDPQVEGVFRALSTSKERLDLPEHFSESLERVLFSICQDETKPMLRGVFWTASGALLSADGFRLTAVTPGPHPVKCPRSEGLLLPDALLTRLGARRRELRALQLEETVMWLSLESAVVYGRLLEGTFPYARVAAAFSEIRARTKSQQGTWLTFDPEEPLVHILNRLLLFADPPIYALTATIEPGGLRLTSGREGASGEEFIKAEVQGPEGSFKVNGAFLRDLLERAPTLWYGGPEVPLYGLSTDRRFEHLVLCLSD